MIYQKIFWFVSNLVWSLWLCAEPVVWPPEQRRHGHGGAVVVVIVAPAAAVVIGDRDGPRLGAAVVDETLHQAAVVTKLNDWSQRAVYWDLTTHMTTPTTSRAKADRPTWGSNPRP